MVGIPYVASGPLAHTLALDKVVTKMILQQQGLPTPSFAVLQTPDDTLPEGLRYPMVVKPKNEAVSIGLAIVNDEDELRSGARVIFDTFGQAVLAEAYIEGREVNVGLLGNNPPHAFPPVELRFGEGGPNIYTYEDKTGQSGREISYVCPAPIEEHLAARAQDIAKRAFMALGCYDCARVDMRLDDQDNLYILEVNSLPSLGEHGSYLVGAAHEGLDFEAFVNRLLEEASSRYFGTPAPPDLPDATTDPQATALAYVTQRREQMERRIKEWTSITSRSNDPVGVQQAVQKAESVLHDVGLRPVADLTDDPEAYTWESKAGLEGGTLIVVHVDSPLGDAAPHEAYRRDPEWLYGEAVGTSRAPLAMLEFALRSLRSIRRLRNVPLGVLLYTDEGREAQASMELIRAASARVKRTLVLRPGTKDHGIVTKRRGARTLRLQVDAPPQRPGHTGRRLSLARWTWRKLEELAALTSAKDGISVDPVDFRLERHPSMLPHRVRATILLTYRDASQADAVEQGVRETLRSKEPKVTLVTQSNRPAMKERKATVKLATTLMGLASEWDIPLVRESSVTPSVAGLVEKGPCVCGLAPLARDLGTPREAVLRTSLVQRTLLLAEFLAGEL
jgi:D-alanine-D-alanine ligase